jgi:hypothetical protein
LLRPEELKPDEKETSGSMDLGIEIRSTSPPTGQKA